MVTAKGKKRYNLHLNEEKTEAVRNFIALRGMTLSGYLDMVLNLVYENIFNSSIDVENPDKPLEMRELFDILKISEYREDIHNQSLSEILEENPELIIDLIKKGHVLKLSARHNKKKFPVD